MIIDWGREICGNLGTVETREWLCTNGIGGYASGTVAGSLTRRYHGLLVAALQPPLGRTLLVAKLDETVAYGGLRCPLFINRWAAGTVDPHGYRSHRAVSAARGRHRSGPTPWPTPCLRGASGWSPGPTRLKDGPRH